MLFFIDDEFPEQHISADFWLYSRLRVTIRQSLPSIHDLQQSQFQRKGAKKATEK